MNLCKEILLGLFLLFTAFFIGRRLLALAAVVCDTHCIRITNLLGLTTSKDPYKVEMQLREKIPPEKSTGFCHRMVLLGREYCIARRPQCIRCPLRPYCPGQTAEKIKTS